MANKIATLVVPSKLLLRYPAVLTEVYHKLIHQPVGFLTVMCLVTWPLNESEAGVERPPCFSYVNVVVLMLISWNLHKKINEVSIKTGQL